LSSELYMLAVMSIMASDKASLFLCLATSPKVRIRFLSVDLCA
jgi:hypothetical protein